MTIPANCLSPPTTATYIAFACMMVRVSAVVFGLIWYLKHIDRRDRQRWQREVELRHQRWELEQQIWRESLPDWQREAIEGVDRKRAEMRQEARRRLGLPEEAPHPACEQAGIPPISPAPHRSSTPSFAMRTRRMWTDVDEGQMGGDGCISLRTGTGTASGWAA
jgi:hypothetical protein